ncbi:MAG: NUDIX domain-containing protein [Nocardioidaceae bacterium]
MTDCPYVLVPASYLLLLRDRLGEREVLLQRRANTGFMDNHWAAAAAGHVERGESCTAAGVREAREELGIEVALDDVVPLCAVHRHQDTDRAVDQRVDFFFTVARWRGEPRLVEDQKASALDWFDLSELPAPVVPHELAVLEALSSGRVPPVLTAGH